MTLVLSSSPSAAHTPQTYKGVISSNRNDMTRSRPVSKTRKLDPINPSFVVTSRPIPPSTSGSVADWVAIDVEQTPHASMSSLGKQSMMNGKRKAGSHGRSLSDGTPMGPREKASEEDEQVKDTTRIKLAYDAKGRRMVNQYVRLKEIGRGTHGRVWLCEEVDENTGASLGLCAMKEVYREEPQRNLKKAQTAAHGSNAPGFKAPLMATSSSTHTPKPSLDKEPNPPLRQMSTPTPTLPKQHDGFLPPIETDTHIGSSNSIKRFTHPQHSPQHKQYEGSDLSSAAGSSSHIDNITPTEAPAGPVAGLYMAKQRARRSPLQMDEKVRQEIAIMKRCNHKHVVKLKEVINDPQSKKIFMVLEYLAGGQIIWQQPSGYSEPTMTVDEARETFRDVVLGLEYLHYQGIIHRDIKPANLLWTDDTHTRVKISDFGVSHLSDALSRTDSPSATDGDLRKTAGSPAFFAPELCYSADSPLSTPFNLPADGPSRSGSEKDIFANSFLPSQPAKLKERPLSSRTITTISRPLLTSRPSKQDTTNKPKRPPIGKAIDVWALGVTLYCLLFGNTPFRAETEYMLYNVIPREEAPIPEWIGADHLSAEGEEGREIVDLLSRLLEKDPLKRISLAEVKAHPWVLRKLTNPAEWLDSTNPAHAPALTVTTEDVQHATADRFNSSDKSGLRGSLKRAMARFGNVLRSRRPSADSNSTSALSSQPDAWSEGSSSRVASRQPSMVSQRPRNPSSPPQIESAIGRKWSIRNRVGANQNTSSAKVTPTEHTPVLSRSLSGSSAGTSGSVFDHKSQPVLGLEVPPSMRRPISAGEFSTDPAFGDELSPRKSFSSVRGDRTSSATSPTGLGNDLESKLSIRYVWDRLRSGSRTPNSSPNPRGRRSGRSDISGTEEDTTDGESVQPVSLYATNSRSVESIPEMARADFDAFGRKIKAEEAEEDEDDQGSENEDEVDQNFSDDSLSELDQPISNQGSSNALAWNSGSGWTYGEPATTARDESFTRQFDEAEEDADEDQEEIRTPRAAVVVPIAQVLENGTTHHSPLSSPTGRSLSFSGRPLTTSPSQAGEESGIYSGDDADGEHGSDSEAEEEAEVPLDIKSRRRRPTYETLSSPIDLHPPSSPFRQ